MFERGYEVTTNLNQPILVADNSIPVDTVEEVICSPPKKWHKRFNEESIIMGKQLTDLEIDYAQRLLKSQFPHLNGLCFNKKHALRLTKSIKIQFK